MNDTLVAGPTINASTIINMKMDELKAELKRRKLKTTGNKADLAMRLRTALTLDDERDDEPTHLDDDEEINNETRRYVPTFKDVEESMNTFSGDDGINVGQWVSEFEDIAELCMWSDIQKVIYAKRLLRGSAKMFVAYAKCATTWMRLRTSLSAEFSRKIDSNKVNKELSKRKKKHDETYQQYVYAMLGITMQANLEIAAVIQYVIDGIEDEEHNKTILYGAITIEDLKFRLEQYETMKYNAKRRQRPEERNKRPPMTQSPTVIKRCGNCGAKEHTATDCPHKTRGAKCFHCNEFGHIAARCPAKEP